MQYSSSMNLKVCDVVNQKINYYYVVAECCLIVYMLISNIMPAEVESFGYSSICKLLSNIPIGILVLLWL
jgi:hypothetical protein